MLCPRSIWEIKRKWKPRRNYLEKATSKWQRWKTWKSQSFPFGGKQFVREYYFFHGKCFGGLQPRWIENTLHSGDFKVISPQALLWQLLHLSRPTAFQNWLTWDGRGALWILQINKSFLNSVCIALSLSQVVLRDQTDYYGYVAWGEYPHCFAAVLNQAGNNSKLKRIICSSFSRRSATD